MKFCSKCGKELHDEAVICVGCGCAVQDSSLKKTYHTDSVEYEKLMTFVSEANTIYVLGIVSLILCLGIGIIFQIINLVKVNKYVIKGRKELNCPTFNIHDPNSIMIYENAKKKVDSGRKMTAYGFIISVVVIALGLYNTVIQWMLF